MSQVFVRGLGAVSPAGWGVAALREALEKNEPLPAQPLARPGWECPLLIRPVPPAPARQPFTAHPRLRRTGMLTLHVTSAALEAMGDEAEKVQAGELRLGIAVCVMAGNVGYSRRFYQEALLDPATASPLLFPETVFNASASHLAAYLGSTGVCHTLVGDDGTFLQGLAMGAQWLVEGQVDACLVVGAEEMDWVVADALRLFDRDAVHGSGAGAIYLSNQHNQPAVAELERITDAFSFTATCDRAQAARRMRAQIAGGAANEMLCLGKLETEGLDAAETSAWADWPGQRCAVRKILGQGFTAAAAWQCVAACDGIQRQKFPAANVSVVGVNQQAIGARFVRPKFSDKE